MPELTRWPPYREYSGPPSPKADKNCPVCGIRLHPAVQPDAIHPTCDRRPPK